MTSPNLQRGDRVEELVERLRAGKKVWHWSHLFLRYPGCDFMLVNPDGPDAALEIERLRALQSPEAVTDELRDALKAIASQAICYGMRADETELRDWLKFISETADAALLKVSPR